MTSGILFDFNGVIVDDESQHCDALIATLSDYGYALDRDTYYRDYLGFDDRECFRFTFERMGRPQDEASLREAIERKHAEYERSIRASMRLVAGVSDFIENAALDGFQLAIVSGALRSEIELVLRWRGSAPISPRSSRRKTWAPASRIRRGSIGPGRSWSWRPSAAS